MPRPVNISMGVSDLARTCRHNFKPSMSAGRTSSSTNNRRSIIRALTIDTSGRIGGTAGALHHHAVVPAAHPGPPGQ